jgi:hypothetical protein
MKWVEHVACMGEITDAYKILIRKPEGRDHLEDLGVDEKIILELILVKQGGKVWTGCFWLSDGFL